MEWVFVLLFVAAAATAIRIRNAMEDPMNPFGRWFDKHARPRLTQAMMAVFGLTVIGWIAIYLTAPEQDHKGLTEMLQGLWQQFDEDKARVRPQLEGGGRRP